MDEEKLLRILDTDSIAEQVCNDLDSKYELARQRDPTQLEYHITTEFIWVPPEDVTVLPPLARSIITRALVKLSCVLGLKGVGLESFDWRPTVHNVPGNGLVRSLPWLTFSKKYVNSFAITNQFVIRTTNGPVAASNSAPIGPAPSLASSSSSLPAAPNISPNVREQHYAPPRSHVERNGRPFNHSGSELRHVDSWRPRREQSRWSPPRRGSYHYDHRPQRRSRSRSPPRPRIENGYHRDPLRGPRHVDRYVPRRGEHVPPRPRQHSPPRRRVSPKHSPVQHSTTDVSPPRREPSPEQERAPVESPPLAPAPEPVPAVQNSSPVKTNEPAKKIYLKDPSNPDYDFRLELEAEDEEVLNRVLQEDD